MSLSRIKYIKIELDLILWFNDTHFFLFVWGVLFSALVEGPEKTTML